MLAQILEFIVAHPWIYDRVQRMAGRDINYRRLRPLLYRARGERVLDAGGGTGEIARIIDPSTRYVCLDNDEQKLTGFLSKGGKGSAVLGDATRIPFQENAFHTAVSVAVSHHLTDGELDRLLSELARVCHCQLIFLDAVRERSLLSNLMWRYDRGRNPRTAEHLLSIIRRHFALEDIQRYKIYHHYLLCIGRPVCAVEEAPPPPALLESQS